jgi:hypothetical protein
MMALPLDPKEVAYLEETIRMEMTISQALTNVLVRKGLVSEHETMEEVKKLKGCLPKAA